MAGTILESINSIHDNEMGLVLTRLVFPNAICNTSQSKSVGHCEYQLRAYFELR
jgi:hypothetical protein